MSRSRLFKLALPAVVALGAGTAVAIAAIPSTSDGVIHGCYLTTATAGHTIGELRVIDADATPTQNCAANEATLTWDQQGPVGPHQRVGRRLAPSGLLVEIELCEEIVARPVQLPGCHGPPAEERDPALDLPFNPLEIARTLTDDVEKVGLGRGSEERGD